VKCSRKSYRKNCKKVQNLPEAEDVVTPKMIMAKSQSPTQSLGLMPLSGQWLLAPPELPFFL